jgi:hypothetical protein
MSDQSIVVHSSNLRDFYKYRWILLLVTLIWGGAMILFLFRLKWLLIITFAVLYFSLRKAFRIEVKLSQNKILFKKRFLGIPYNIIKQPFTKVLFFENPEIINFQGMKDELFIYADSEGINLVKPKYSMIICTKREAEKLMKNLKQAIKNVGIKNDVHILQ